MTGLDPRAMEELARYFAALAVPVRLIILHALRDGERNVGELTEATGCTQANVSKHLALLAHNGFVRKEARGTSVYYSIADSAIYGLCDMVCGQIGRRYAEQSGLERLFRAQAGKNTGRKRRVRQPVRQAGK